MGLTIGLLVAGAIVLALSAWRHGRPHDPVRGPRMVPWAIIMLIAATWCLVMLVHIINLLGVQTGGGRPRL